MEGEISDQIGVEQRRPSMDIATNGPRYVATIWHDPDRSGIINRKVGCLVMFLLFFCFLNVSILKNSHLETTF